MITDRPHIQFTVSLRGQTKEITTYKHEYRNLMSLLYDKFYIENFGDCRGIGRCGTCHVKIDADNPKLMKRIGNEQTTLDRMENVGSNSRLSCHILVTEDLNQTHLTIADDGDLGLY